MSTFLGGGRFGNTGFAGSGGGGVVPAVYLNAEMLAFAGAINAGYIRMKQSVAVPAVDAGYIQLFDNDPNAPEMQWPDGVREKIVVTD